MTMDLEHMPLLQKTKNTIEQKKKYVDLLNNRKILIGSNKQDKSEYEKNEDEIILLITDNKLAALYSEIKSQEDYFQKFSDVISLNLEAANEKFDMVYAKALAYKANAEVKIQIERTLEQYKQFDIETNYEARIQLYILLKELVVKKKP
jgi:hypothetical protein